MAQVRLNPAADQLDQTGMSDRRELAVNLEQYNCQRSFAIADVATRFVEMEVAELEKVRYIYQNSYNPGVLAYFVTP